MRGEILGGVLVCCCVDGYLFEAFVGDELGEFVPEWTRRERKTK